MPLLLPFLLKEVFVSSARWQMDYFRQAAQETAAEHGLGLGAIWHAICMRNQDYLDGRRPLSMAGGSMEDWDHAVVAVREALRKKAGVALPPYRLGSGMDFITPFFVGRWTA